MKRKLALVALAVVLIATTAFVAIAQRLTVTITSPRDGAPAERLTIISGTVSNPSASVWVIVHPLAVAKYWVQPRINVRAGGVWSVQIYVGEPGPAHVGQHFEIRAVADPEAVLQEGLILDDWPRAAASSDTIMLIRQ